MKIPKTIEGVDGRMRVLIIRIARDGEELNKLRIARRAMIVGKRKVLPPKGIKHTIAGAGFTKTRDFNLKDFDDPLP